MLTGCLQDADSMIGCDSLPYDSVVFTRHVLRASRASIILRNAWHERLYGNALSVLTVGVTGV